MPLTLGNTQTHKRVFRVSDPASAWQRPNTPKQKPQRTSSRRKTRAQLGGGGGASRCPLHKQKSSPHIRNPFNPLPAPGCYYATIGANIVTQIRTDVFVLFSCDIKKINAGLESTTPAKTQDKPGQLPPRPPSPFTQFWLPLTKLTRFPSVPPHDHGFPVPGGVIVGLSLVG